MPDFAWLEKVAQKYLKQLLDAQGDDDQDTLPAWWHNTYQCLYTDGGSPRQMQLEMMQCLNRRE